MELKDVAVRDRIERISSVAEGLRWERAASGPRLAGLRRAAGSRLIQAGLALLPSSVDGRRLRAPLPSRALR